MKNKTKMNGREIQNRLLDLMDKLDETAWQHESYLPRDCYRGLFRDCAKTINAARLYLNTPQGRESSLGIESNIHTVLMKCERLKAEVVVKTPYPKTRVKRALNRLMNRARDLIDEDGGDGDVVYCGARLMSALKGDFNYFYAVQGLPNPPPWNSKRWEYEASLELMRRGVITSDALLKDFVRGWR